MERIKDFVKWHYSSTTYHRTEKQLQREEWLIPGVLKFNRFYLMPAALLIQVRHFPRSLVLSLPVSNHFLMTGLLRVALRMVRLQSSHRTGNLRGQRRFGQGNG